MYRAGQPSLYLNGRLARTGLKSTHTVHSGAGQNNSAKYRGRLGGIEQIDERGGDESTLGIVLNIKPLGLLDTARGKLIFATGGGPHNRETGTWH